MKEVEAKKVVLSSKYSSEEKLIVVSRNTPICMNGYNVCLAFLLPEEFSADLDFTTRQVYF